MRKASLFRFVVVAASLASAHPAAARLDRSQLARVVVDPVLGAQAPLDVVFTDAVTDRLRSFGDVVGNRPTLLLPVDYTCGNVCDPMLSMSGTALRATGLAAALDYVLVLVGLDPRDGAEAARHMLQTDLETPPAGTAALVGDDAAVTRLTHALGYGFLYDASIDGFAHPAAAMILTRDGRLARVLSPLALNGRDLRLALIEAGEGRTGSLADRLILLCYGYDAAMGAYTPLIQRILSLAAAATVVAIVGLIAILSRRRRA